MSIHKPVDNSSQAGKFASCNRCQDTFETGAPGLQCTKLCSSSISALENWYAKQIGVHRLVFISAEQSPLKVVVYVLQLHLQSNPQGCTCCW